jgi:hypothetical protein
MEDGWLIMMQITKKIIDNGVISSDINRISHRSLRRRVQGCLSGWPLLYTEGA